ncbi:lipocalin family protein [Paracoccus aminophilus]|uniref:Uncharacterized protein n=1 Tax=Paracoccus aminophilus JCM 7686 TaxID=1367847 RepID=S5XPV4_PARAH|nr:lipocalin family protein [Paracoccus aminophilus]AGT09379.1 hypothetical protein JCM7686_2309 [Paracoccus aminophilus JCM 7686]
MVRLKCLAIAALFALPGSLASAERYQYSNSIYELPKGWGVYRATEAYQLLGRSGATSCEQCDFLIARSAPAKGELTDFLAQNAPHLLDPGKDETLTLLEPPKLIKDGGWTYAFAMARVSDDDFLFLLATKAGDRYEMIALRAPSGNQATVKEAAEIFQSTGLGLASSMRYVSEGAVPLMPPATPGRLDGLWSGTSMNSVLGLDGMLRMEASTRHLVFWGNGYFYDGTPPDGLALPAPATLREPIDTRIGTYRISGDKLDLTFADGTTGQLTLNQNTMADGSRTLYPMKLLPDGSTISGSISDFYFMGFTPGTIGGGVSSSSFFAYKKDGTYSGSSSGGASATFTNGSGDTTGGFASGSQAKRGGTYEIRDGLLISHPADGSAAIKALIYKNGDSIYIGDSALSTD